MEISRSSNVVNAEVVLDKDFDIISGNREFLRLFDIIEAKGSFLEYLDDNDIIKFQDFIKTYNTNIKTKAIALTLTFSDISILALIKIKEYNDSAYLISIDNLEFANEVIDGVITTNKEYEILLSSFDSEFLVYSYKDNQVLLKNTKNLQPLYSCSLDDLRAFLENRYDLDLEIDFTKDAIERIESDIENKNGGKRYSLILKNKKYIILSGYMIDNDENSQYLITINMANNLKESKSSYRETHDGLTGLLNKETITDFAKQRINIIKSECSIVVLDIDKFKEYNDAFGHQYGDNVLVNVSKAIKNAVMQYGEVGRFGGDEFLIVINSADEEIVRMVCRSIRLAIQWSLPVENPDVAITCSMGISRYPLNGDSFEKLFELADKCLYLAKDKGRNCYIIYRSIIHDKKFESFDERNDNIVSGKLFHEKSVYEGKILESLYEKKDYKLALELLYEYVGVNQITLYDSLLIPILKLGGPKNIREELLKKNDYFKFLNKYDYFMLDNTNILDTIDKVRFRMYSQNQIGSTLEIVNRDNEGEVAGMIVFDKLKPSKTFDRSKLSFLLTVSKKIISMI